MGRLITGLPVLEEHNGALHFGTDVWSSPNHKAYVAVTVQFEESGKPVSMLLDLVRVAQSHSRINLAAAFKKILDNFGILEKVSVQLWCHFESTYLCV